MGVMGWVVNQRTRRIDTLMILRDGTGKTDIALGYPFVRMRGIDASGCEEYYTQDQLVRQYRAGGAAEFGISEFFL